MLLIFLSAIYEVFLGSTILPSALILFTKPKKCGGAFFIASTAGLAFFNKLGPPFIAITPAGINASVFKKFLFEKLPSPFLGFSGPSAKPALPPVAKF